MFVIGRLLTGPNQTHIVDFKAKLNAAFKMSNSGLKHHYFDIQFLHYDGDITLCQTKYVENLLQRFGLEDYKPFAPPIETSL